MHTNINAQKVAVFCLAPKNPANKRILRFVAYVWAGKEPANVVCGPASMFLKPPNQGPGVL